MRKHNPKDNGVQMPFESDIDFVSMWQDWLEYRKQRRLPNYVPKGLKGTFTHLVNISDNNPKIAIQILKRSMDLNYQGFFPLPINYNNGTAHKRTTEEKPTPSGNVATGDFGKL